MKAELLVQVDCLLGEGTLWHNKRMSLFWVDIESKALFELDTSSKVIKKWSLPQRVSAVFECRDKDTVLLALEEGLAFFNLAAGQLQWHVHIEKEIITNRGNDGKCDAMGRLWIGTMDIACKDHCGSLYSIGGGHAVTRVLTPLSIPNGMAWNADSSKMYFIDTPTRKINAYNFDLASGEIAFERVAVHIPPAMGMPDGMCIDREGMLWVAHWGGYGVYRWDPLTGELLDTIVLPCPYVTNCAFGNKDLDTLFITTARNELTEDQLKEYPLSGSVFMAKPLVGGTAANVYNGDM